MPVLVWTFQLVGGDPFGLHVLNNPAVQHEGGISIWHLRINKVQAQEVQDLASRYGVRIRAYCETETDEQTEMHTRLFESEASLFQCAECPNCYWLDLQTEGYCGAQSWARERRVAALEAFESARTDLGACPVQERS